MGQAADEQVTAEHKTIEQPAPAQPGRWKIVGILFGLAVVIFTAIVLVLNYFNILSVSDTFPNQLGWLPKQQAKLASQGDALQDSNSTPTQEKVPTGTFQYDSAKAEKLLTQYIKDTLKPEYLPDEIEVIQSTRSAREHRSFNISFRTGQAQAYATIRYRENANEQSYLGTNIQYEGSSISTPSADLVNSILTTYFTNPLSVSMCEISNESASVCGYTSTSSDGKTMNSLLILKNAKKPIYILSTCFIPKDSEYYDIKTCF